MEFTVNIMKIILQSKLKAITGAYIYLFDPKEFYFDI
jgi:hypothetical protein